MNFSAGVLKLALQHETSYLPSAPLLWKYLNEASGVLVCIINDLARLDHGLPMEVMKQYVLIPAP